MYSFYPKKYILFFRLLIIAGISLVLFYLKWSAKPSSISVSDFIIIYIFVTGAISLGFIYFSYNPKIIKINNEYISFQDSKREEIIKWEEITEARYKVFRAALWLFKFEEGTIKTDFDGLTGKEIDFLNQFILNKLSENGFQKKSKFPTIYRKS